jgi:endonuclease YncB( thermonuclease family)
MRTFTSRHSFAHSFRPAPSALRGWHGLIACVLAIAAPALLTAADERLPTLPGVVTRVIDGDTIDVELSSGPIRVRLHAIDTPERGQPWEPESTAALTGWVLDKHVDLEPFEQDRYERLVATVLLDDKDINARLVQEGYAWAYRAYMTRADKDLCQLEADARKAKRGLWALPAEERIAPWEWRQRKKLNKFTDYTRESTEHCVAKIGER